ncbi:MAG: hypothetical protein M3N19_08930 [Candidatus Eremiobacteraeota bacterium]|nr:hypothetical protein [Candidatus Eremiobacteraeota bacterium]
MMTQYFARGLTILALAALVQGCSGASGGTSSASLPPAVPAPVGAASNSLTTYSVFVGQSGSQSVVDVQPFGIASTVPGAQRATSAYVVYPDSSVQQVDALGNFDASQSVWTAQNVNILISNPNNEPVVDVFANASGNPAPDEVSVNAYAPGGAIVLASNLIQTLDAATGTSADLAHITVFPQSASMLDNRTKMFHAVGKDSNGSLVGLSKATIAWTVTRAVGCGSAAGQIKPVPGDASTAIYQPPSSGSVVGTCPDQVVATIGSGSVSHNGTANAYFYDQASAAQLAGVLKTASGSPAANAVINLYAGSAEAQKGSILVRTDVNGKFSRLVPTSRILTPSAALTDGPDKTKAAFFVVAPGSINPAGAGATLGTQSWTITSQAASVAPKSQPPFETLVRDANFYGNAARDAFPLGAPNASGQFAAGSIEYILAHPTANQTGVSSSGPYAGYGFKWDATAKIATFIQPGSSASAKVLTVTLNAAKVGTQACPAAAACFSFARKIGTMLDIDGAWSQALSGTTFSVTYVRNDYNSAHQTAGSPLYSNTLAITQTVGTQNIALAIQRFNSSGKSLGTETITRVGGSGTVLYTYSGTVHALSYKADGSTVAVDAAITNGVENKDYSGALKFAITASPSAGDVGDAVNFAVSAPGAGSVASGTIDGVGLTGLTTGHAASFSVAASGKVTLTKDFSLGGNVITFQL